jgi:hypothetical protein
MKRVLIVMAVMSMPASAQEEVAAAVTYTGIGFVAASAVANAAIFGAFDIKASREHRKPSLTHAVLEVVFSQVHLVGGVALLAFGVDQRLAGFSAAGGIMMAASVPTEVHGMWALGAYEPAASAEEERRRRTVGGGLELGLGLAELAVAGAAAGGFAADPVDHVRQTGLVTIGVVSVVPLAMTLHGSYLLATRNRRARPTSLPVSFAPSPLPGGAAVTIAGRF